MRCGESEPPLAAPGVPFKNRSGAAFWGREHRKRRKARRMTAAVALSNGLLAPMFLRLCTVALLMARPAWAEAVPVFSDTGPDAAAYGAAAGYPPGAAATINTQMYMVG